MRTALCVGAVLAGVMLLGLCGYRSSVDCIGTHCGVVFVRQETGQ